MGERVLLGRIAERYHGRLLDYYALSTCRGGHQIVCATLTYAFVREAMRVVVLIATADSKVVKQLSEGIPSWVTFVVLQPIAVCELAVQWSIFQNMAEQTEFEYQHRRHIGDSDKRTYVVPNDDIPVIGQEMLTDRQHSQFCVVFREIDASLARCLKTRRKLEEITLRVVLRHVQLSRFWTQVECVPDELVKVKENLYRCKVPKGQGSPKVCRAILDMVSGRGFFEPKTLQSDSEAAFHEITLQLDSILQGILGALPD